MRLLGWLLNSVWLFWGALCIPLGVLIADKFVNGAPGGRFFYWTGALSVIFVLITLSVTPLTRIFRTGAWSLWLTKRRRYFGVAGFAYAAAHTLYWLQQAGMEKILHSFVDLTLVLGWLGFAVFTAMAMTSNDYSVRRLGRTWKTLQSWIYLAMPLALLHWFAAEGFKRDTIYIYGGAFAILMVIRVLVRRRSTETEGG